MKHWLNFILINVILFMKPNLARAEIEVVQQLSFGTIALLKNDQVYRLSIDRQGDINYDSPYRLLDNPKRALFRVTNLVPNRSVFVIATIDSGTMRSAELNTGTFTIESLDVTAIQFSDEFGELLIPVGAIIASSGDNNMIFGSGVLRGRISLEINL